MRPNWFAEMWASLRDWLARAMLPASTVRKKVLVADDERQIVKLVEINLSKVGHDVICAYDWAQALEKALSDRPDVVVLDAIMPGMNGCDVVRRLQSVPETRSIRVIALLTDSRDVALFRDLRIHASLVKPFSPRDLLRMVDDREPPSLPPPAGLRLA